MYLKGKRCLVVLEGRFDLDERRFATNLLILLFIAINYNFFIIRTVRYV